MTTKQCSKCNQVLDLSSFAKRGKATYQSRCRSCQKDYARQHYLRNREKYKAKASNQRTKMLAKVHAIKESTPCADCGKKYPACVMDFDHLPGTEKVDNVACLCRNGRSEKVIEDEIAKCELVCANCHRIRTNKRRGL